MPITFGSVGDIISVSLLVKDLLLALDSSKGSSTGYQAVVSELNVLDKALLQVAQLANKHAPTPELHALWETAKHSVDKCRIAVDSFTKRIDKYRNSLREGGSYSSIKDAARKIQWQMCQKDEVTRFRVEIAGYTDSITMLVATANVALLKIAHTSVNDNIEKAAEQTRVALDHQNEVLKQIQVQLEDSKQLTVTIESMATKMSDRFEWIRNLGKELKTFMIGIMATNFRIYREIVAIRTAVNQIGRPLAEDPFTLDDPIGRKFPVHLRFIASWEAFESVMELNFKGRRGSRKVKNKDYILHDQATNKEIIRAQDWDNAFLPGQRVTMSLIFRDEITGDGGSDLTQCPHCRATSDEPADTNTQCKNCNKWFCRIVEIREIEQPADQFQIPVRGKTPLKFGEASLGNGKPIYGPKLPRRSDTITPPHTPPRTPLGSTPERETQSDSDDEEITGIKRVHFLTKKLRYKQGIAFLSFAARDAFQALNFNSSTAKNLTRGHPIDWNKWEFPAVPAPGAKDATSSCDEEMHDVDQSVHDHKDLVNDDVFCKKTDNNTVIIIEETGQEELETRILDEKTTKIRTSEGSNYGGPRDNPSVIDPSRPPKNGYYASKKEKSLPTAAHHRSRYSYQSCSTYQYTGMTTRSVKHTSPRPRKATEQDARRAGIPVGFSTKNWDPTEEPITLLGSVFDANSLGKWIYDWTVFCHGPATPMSDVAGELWLLLIQLAGKIKRADSSMSRIRLDESRELVEDFLDSGERLWGKLVKMLKVCEDYMWKAAESVSGDIKSATLGKDSGYEFVNSIFGRERELDRTERLMSAIRLWSMRFDANCDDILRNPTAGYKTTTKDTASCNEETVIPQAIPTKNPNEAHEDSLGKTVSSSDHAVLSSKRKLDDVQNFIEEVAPKRQRISTDLEAQEVQRVDAREVEGTNGPFLKRKADEELEEKQQAYGAKKTKVTLEVGNKELC